MTDQSDPDWTRRATPEAFASLDDAADWLGAWLRDAALPIWWRRGADRERGGFHEALSVGGEPRPGPRRARVQSRQAYVYAVAGLLEWDGPWREAAWHAMDFLVEGFRRPDGLFRTLLAVDGSTADDRAMLYENAFVLLSTATLHRADPNGPRDLAALAEEVRTGLDRMRHPVRGYVENIAHPYQANAHMHLLEGALAWAELRGGAWEAMADEIGDLALDVLIDAQGGFVREFFGADWSPAPGDDGRLVEPGHQFEWAWLMHRWGRRRGRSDALAAAGRLFEAGRRGVDGRGVTVNALWDELSVRDPLARLWPQTEHLKACLALGTERQGMDAAEALRFYLQTPARGVWHDSLRPDGTFVDGPAPATSLYHIVCAFAELAADRASLGRQLRPTL